MIVGGTGGKWMMGFGRTIRAMLTSPFVKQRLRALISSPNSDDLVALAGLVEAGRITPVVGSTHPLSNAAGAIELVGVGAKPREGHRHHRGLGGMPLSQRPGREPGVAYRGAE